MPLIAVVIPTIDGSHALRRSLQSMTQQTRKPDEVIVVANGAHATGIAQSVASWSELEPAPIVLEIGDPPNVARALNAGIELAQSQYIVRMDAGDWSYPNRIAVQLRAMEADQLDLVASDYKAITPAGVELPGLRGAVPPDVNAIRWHLLVHNCIAHPTVIVRRQSVLDAGYYSEDALFEDYDLWLRMLQQWRMRVLDLPLIEYGYSSRSQTRKVKAEGSRQLTHHYQEAWRNIAHIEISESAAGRLLAPALRALPGLQHLHDSREAMAALSALEHLASTELGPDAFAGLKQRISISRAELFVTTALANPTHPVSIITQLPKSAIAPTLSAAWRLARFSLKLRSAEILRLHHARPHARSPQLDA